MHKATKRRILNQSKKPITKDRYVGVEIEFIAPMNAVKVKDALLNADLHSYTQLKEDGSIETHDEYGDRECLGCRENNCFWNHTREECTCSCICYKGHEVCILAKEKEIEKIVTKVCRVLQGIGADVNSSCGLHVHLDMRSRVPEQAYRNLVHAQDVLIELVDPSRRDNEYCQPQNEEAFKQASWGERYTAINACSYAKHKTIEVRLHESTIYAPAINDWIKLLIVLTDAKRYIQVPYKNKKDLQKQVRLPKRVKSYLDRKVA
jgi:hypothetical protein